MKNKKSFFGLLIALVVVLAFAGILYHMLGDTPMPGYLAQQETDSDGSDRELVLAPDFTVYDENGNAVRLSDFRGKPVVLNFWVSWCGPCKMEMPAFQSKYEALEGEVQFLMINATDGSRETVETAKGFLAESGYTFPVYYDTDYSAIYAYGINAFPTTFFIDAEGYGVAYGQSAMSAETLQMGIDMICE